MSKIAETPKCKRVVKAWLLFSVFSPQQYKYCNLRNIHGALFYGNKDSARQFYFSHQQRFSCYEWSPACIPCKTTEYQTNTIGIMIWLFNSGWEEENVEGWLAAVDCWVPDLDWESSRYGRGCVCVCVFTAGCPHPVSWNTSHLTASQCQPSHTICICLGTKRVCVCVLARVCWYECICERKTFVLGIVHVLLV